MPGIPGCEGQSPDRSSHLVRTTRRQAQLDCRHICCAIGVAQCTGPPAIEGVHTGHRHRRRRQYTSNRRCTHRAPSPAPSAVHPKSQAWAHGAVTSAVRSLYPVILELSHMAMVPQRRPSGRGRHQALHILTCFFVRLPTSVLCPFVMVDTAAHHSCHLPLQ